MKNAGRTTLRAMTALVLATAACSIAGAGEPTADEATKRIRCETAFDAASIIKRGLSKGLSRQEISDDVERLMRERNLASDDSPAKISKWIDEAPKFAGYPDFVVKAMRSSKCG